MNIDIGGHSALVSIVAGEDPPLVAVSAMGTDAAQWLPVIERLTTRTSVITYDRPGTGAAPARPAPNPALPYSAFADELATMLGALDVTTQVVAVGHSFGSLIVRSFAARHPSRVAGMVHVDGSKPALTLWPGDGPLVDGRDGEGTQIDAILGSEELRSAKMPDVPVVVLCRTPGRWYAPPPDPTADQSWQDHQVDLARQCDAPLIIATDSGHNMPGEAPDLVAFAIDEVVRSTRRGRSSMTLDPFHVKVAGGSLWQGLS